MEWTEQIIGYKGGMTNRIIRTGNGTLHKLVVSFTARQTFARLA